MHHPREAVIDGVQFVLIREDLLEEVKNFIGQLRGSYSYGEIQDHNRKIVELTKRLGEL
jgi:hypothetical protein